MRVLSFSYCFPNHQNPTWGVHVFQRVSAVARRSGIELQAVAPVPTFPLITRLRACPGPETETWQGLAVHRPRFFYVPSVLKWLDGPLYGRGLRRWLAELCQRWRPHLLEAQFEWPDGVGVSHLARRLGVPYVITLSGWLYECMKDARMLRQCVEALQRAASVISVSTHLAETAIELGTPRGKTHVIANGVDVERFQPRDKLEARRLLGLPEQRRLLVTVAHLGPQKGHCETILALAKLPPDVRLVLVGGDTSGGRNVKALRRLLRSLRLEDRVIFAGTQLYDRVPLYFNAADVSVLASWREGCPNVLLESLASGTPVVASNVGHVSAIIDDGRNGKIVPPRKVEPLAEAIEELLDRPRWPQEVRNSPAVRSWDDVAADICNTLGKALKSGCLSDAASQRVDDVAQIRETTAAGRSNPEVP